MSKAQEFVDKVKRFQFWILCGLVSIVGIVSWWLATSSLANTYTTNKSKIESEASKIGTVKGISPHPNEKWNVEIGKQVEEDRKKVEQAWRRLYNEQKQKVYVWPPELGDDFINHVQNLPPGGEIRGDLRDRYLNEVLKQFQALAKLVDAEWENPNEAASTGEPGRYPGIELGPGEVPRKVIWNNQAALQTPYLWPERPTTMQVLYAQEEIWVLNAICQAIAKGNEGSTGAHDAAVRMIEEMSVGYDAAEEFPNGTKEPGRITPVKGSAVAAGSSQMGYGLPSSDTSGTGGYGLPSTPGDGEAGGGTGALPRPERPDRQGMGASRESSSQMGYGLSREGAGSTTTGLLVPDAGAAPEAASTNPDDYLNDWRYVNADGKPLTKEELPTSSLPEYRLMPWRARMTVDQRRWDELMVMFRNTDLPLEIRQVRVNPILDGSSGYTSRGGDTARMPFAPGGASRLPAGLGRSSSMGYGRSRESSMTMGTEETGDTLMLELRGVAYLMNPPDLSKIGVAAGTAAAAPGDASADATAPAAVPEAVSAPTGAR